MTNNNEKEFIIKESLVNAILQHLGQGKFIDVHQLMSAIQNQLKPVNEEPKVEVKEPNKPIGDKKNKGK